MKTPLSINSVSESLAGNGSRIDESVGPPSTRVRATRPVDAATARTLDLAFKTYTGPSLIIRLCDGSVWQSDVNEPSFAIVLKSEQAWKTLTSMPYEVSLGRQYVEGGIEVEGDFFAALRAVPALRETIRASQPPAALFLHEFMTGVANRARRLLRFGAKHSRFRDAAAISHHYDKPPSFYRLFLGPSMVYSCAYFQQETNDLTKAQGDKMELICRKLHLQTQDRFLDIGCGWGSLLVYAVKTYGVSGLGVSLSQQQVAYAKTRIAEERLESRCDVAFMDYRDLIGEHRQFDKLASVGMCEHVGHNKIDSYFRNAYGLLAPGGLFLNHGITLSAKVKWSKNSFVDRYVFPDGELLTLNEIVRSAENVGFEVRDVDNLREHYEETLHRWVESLSENEQEAVTLTDRQTFRIWKLYMAGSAEAFRRGEIAIHQLLLSKASAGKSSAARVRNNWYR